MEKEELKEEKNILSQFFNKKTKIIIIIAFLTIIGYNIKYSKNWLIKRNKNKKPFQPLVKMNDFKPLIFNKDENKNDLIDTNFFLLKKELENKNLSEVNKKRTFEKRYPLPKEIKCQEHLKSGGLIDMMAFTSFLTKDTIFFEFASGCSTQIAKYYTKKTYAVEGNKKWYDIGVNNGLKDNLLFKDLKCDGTGPLLSWPGNKSSIEDWKNFIQAYKEEYNADVIFIDGRFRVACALDVFNKIKNDTVLLLHECQRKQYAEIENYYDKLYKWKNLCLFKKKTSIKEIQKDILEKYWNIKV